MVFMSFNYPLAYLPRVPPVVVVVMVVIVKLLYIVFFTLTVLCFKVKVYFSNSQMFLGSIQYQVVSIKTGCRPDKAPRLDTYYLILTTNYYLYTCIYARISYKINGKLVPGANS